MEHNGGTFDRQLARRSGVTYTAISVLLALAFLGLATVNGDYTDVARFGGALWVFMLSMIVTMPLVTSWCKKRSQQ
ncbi:MAG: hypothetical protein KIS91_14965 [Anaerolineae bacterium]|jgi:hypothetical protein|nr:hypothetical protein [Anaerolineae bacterium]